MNRLFPGNAFRAIFPLADNPLRVKARNFHIGVSRLIHEMTSQENRASETQMAQSQCTKRLEKLPVHKVCVILTTDRLTLFFEELMPRSRSARAHEEVLKATLKLITDRGIDVTSVDAIAEASGVSKATIYRHWRTKEEICLEALSKVDGEFPVFDSDDPRADLVALLSHVAAARKPETLGKLWPRIVGYAVGNPAFGNALRARFDEPRHEQISRLVTRAIFRGQLRRDLDLNSAPDMLLGPIMYRRLQNTVVPPDLAEKVVDAYWKANAPAAAAIRRTKRVSRKSRKRRD